MVTPAETDTPRTYAWSSARWRSGDHAISQISHTSTRYQDSGLTRRWARTWTTPTAEATKPTRRGMEPNTGITINLSQGRTKTKHQRDQNAALLITQGTGIARAVPGRHVCN